VPAKLLEKYLNKMVNTNTTLVSKRELLDYVSKRDFNDFVAEMRDFRDVTETRFDTVDKRLDSIETRLSGIDRRLDKLGDDFRIQVGAVLDQFKEQMQINREHMQGVEDRLRKEIRENR
jgi:hypothetical protein